jgi:hypothetical protein
MDFSGWFSSFGRAHCNFRLCSRAQSPRGSVTPLTADDEASHQQARSQGIELPSLSVADALRATFSLYRRHFLIIILAIGLLAVPSILVPQFLVFEVPGPPPLERGAARGSGFVHFAQAQGARVLTLLIASVISGPLMSLSTGAAILIASSLMHERHPGVRTAYRASVRRLPALVAADYATSVAIILLMVSIFGLLALPYLALGIQFVAQAIMLERRGPIAAIRRSWELSDGHRWRLLFCLGALWVIGGVLIMLPSQAMHWWTGIGYDARVDSIAVLRDGDSMMQLVWLVDLILRLVETIFYAPLEVLLLTVLYLDHMARDVPYQLPIRPPAPPEAPE